MVYQHTMNDDDDDDEHRNHFTCLHDSLHEGPKQIGGVMFLNFSIIILHVSEEYK